MKENNDKSQSFSSVSRNIPLIVFLFSIVIVMISFVSVIFPALIVGSNTTIIPNIQPVLPNLFELGVWSYGVIISSIVIFGLLYLFYKNKLSSSISKLFKKIFNFEVSKKTAFITLVVILVVYVGFTTSELWQQETWEDYQPIKKRLQESIRDNRWTIEDAINGNPNYPKDEPHVTYTLLLISLKLFGNDKIVPFLASIGLLVITYLITTKITQKRFAGIVAFIIIIQSNLFLTYDTSATYTNFWVLFYLLSLYAVYRFWQLSPISYLISIPAKVLTVAFLPMSIYFILRSDISKKSKIVVTLSTIAIIAAVGITAMSMSSGGEAMQESFDAKEFWMGFTSFSYQLRTDGLVLLFMIPLMVGLFLVSKRGVKHGESIMVLISGILLIVPILTGFTNQTNQPYRFMPLVVFFAIGVGVLLSKRESKI
ncbi:MAG: hypothetical protein AABX32_05900 [Nanoarchaeota archaeon]